MSELNKQNNPTSWVNDKIIHHYYKRIESFLYYLSDEHMIPMTDDIIIKNKMVWLTVIESFVSRGDLEFSLLEKWYYLFSQTPIKQISLCKDHNRELVESISSWKVYVWFTNNYEDIVLITKRYNVSDVVTEILH